MLKTLCFFLQVAVAAALFFVGYRAFREKLNRAERIGFLVLGLCAVFISFSIAEVVQPIRFITVTALQEKNQEALGTELTISKVEIDETKAELPLSLSGKWTWYKGDYRWFEPGDERMDANTTESVTFQFDLADQINIVFWGNKWKGIAEVKVDEMSYVVDTYRAEDGAVRFSVPPLTAGQALRAVGIPLAAFSASLLGICVILALFCMFGKRITKRELLRRDQHSLVQKILKYQFLFEELVSRDFKKKYKRTVLGMAWSVLSPLLTLLVMRLVFTQFFGRTTAHYTIYLFCGNLIFSYFNESTGQGMMSLVGNANIFTKVNVPKYLFLFSKNVQTLINFGLTLCVLFFFCVLDNITFTWKFVCLLYPIILLVLFNIGVGLILSALYVFFKDIQYLWSVFTMLLMYMSAIFYTIDSYSPVVQNLFLLNPVYLFIRYFRKIIIEAAIPSVGFHLLMLADVAIALGIGCWMYKKYNTKFLYYV